MLLPTLPDPEPGLAEGFADSVTGNFEQFRVNDQTILDGVDDTFDYFFGRGVIEDSYTSPVVVAGTGLSANVGPLVALMGRKHVPASGTVLLPASTTSTIWLLQVGAQLVATNGTDPGTDENWSIVLGTATTDATHVTSRSDTFAVVSRPGSSTAGGTVTSVGLSLPGSEFNVGGSPVTVAGTLSGSWKTQAAGKVLASPATGSAAVPTFRPLALSDLPAGTGSTPGVYNVLDYGADRTGTADTSPILETIRTAVGTAGGGVIYYPPGLYWHSTGHVFTTRNLVVRGAGMDETVLEFSDDLGAGALPAPCLHWKCDLSSSISLGADCNPGDRTITLVVGGALASGLSVGDWIQLSDTLSNSATTPNGVFHTRIQAVSGDVLTLERRVPYRFQISQTAIAQFGADTADTPSRLLPGAALSDCTVKVGPSSDGSGHRGTEHAPDLNRCVLVEFHGCDAPACERVRGIGGAYLAATPVIPVTFHAVWSNRPRFVECEARDSGEQGVGYWIQDCTAARVRDSSTDQVGFGAAAQRSAYCQVQGLSYHGRQAQLAGRGVKLEYACTLGEVSGCNVSDAPFMGIYLAQSWDCVIDGNTVAYTAGSELSGPTTRYALAVGGALGLRNRVTNNTVKNVSGYAISLDPAAAGVSTRTLVANNRIEDAYSGIYVAGCDNDLKGNTFTGLSGGVSAVGVQVVAGGARNRIQHNTTLNGGVGRSIRTDTSDGGNFIGGNTDDGLALVLHPTDVLLDVSPTGETKVIAASDSISPSRGDFIYRCDGTADDVEINAAITAIAAKGGTVRLLEGTYNLASRVLITASNVALTGLGPATILKRGYNEGAFAGCVQVGAVDGSSTLSGVTVADMAIDGQKATWTATSNCGVVLRGAVSECEVRNVNVSNQGGYGFYNNGAGARNRYTDCRTTGCANYGLYATGMSDLRLAGLRSTADLGGFRVASIDRLGLSRCSVSGATTGEGIWTALCTRMTVADSLVEGGAARGFFVDTCTRFTLSGNVSNAATSHGIAFNAACTDGTVTGNVCENATGGSGLYTSSAVGVAVSGNRFGGNSRYGIEIPAGTTFVTLGPNDLRGNTLGAISDLSPTTAAGATRHVAQGGAVRALTAAYTLIGEESLVTCDATAAAFGVTLPAASGALRNWRFTVKKTDASANAVTITGTVDGAANPTLNAQNQTRTVVCDGTAYRFEGVAAAVGGTIPIGGIILWSGSVASIPANWHLCDGTTGTPDLRDRFVVGAGSSYAVAASGGSSGHSHALSGAAVVGAATVTQSVDNSGATPRFDTAAAAHIHNMSGSTDSTSSLPPYFSLAWIQRIS